jgi:hypothetical protein
MLRIETDDERAERYVRTAYGALLADPGPEPTDVAALMTATGSVIASFNGVELPREWSGPGKNPWRSGAYITDQFVWRALAAEREWTSLYGCAVVAGRGALLFVGPSGTGKTTLGLALQRLGARVIGDEMIVVNQTDFTVDAIGRRLSVRGTPDDPLDDPALGDVIRRCGSLVGSGKERFLAVDRCAFGALPARARLAATFFVSRGEREPGVVPAGVSRTALAAARYAGRRPQNFDELAQLAAVLGAGRCFGLSLGDPNASARAVLEAAGAC